MHIFKNLKAKFKMKDLGMINHFLGIHIVQKEKSVELDQSVYLHKLLEKYGIQDCKPHTICEQKPTVTYSKLPNRSTRRYREIVGSLIYAMVCTRPDLNWVVTKLSQHLENPDASDWVMLDQMLRYIQGTKNQKLTYLFLHGFSDSTSGGDPGERRSTTGFYFALTEDGLTSLLELQEREHSIPVFM